MPRYAIIENKLVVNVILAESQSDAEMLSELTAIESDSAVIGQVYDESTSEFIFPVTEEESLITELEAAPEAAETPPAE